MGQDSKFLRTSIHAQRQALAPETRAHLSRTILKRAQEQLTHLEGACIALYRPMDWEVDIEPLFGWLRERGARLFFPRMADWKAGLLELVEHREVEEFWAVGPMGISEPSDLFEAADPAEMDWVIVPGAVFDRLGGRLGMGKGFYDRLLPRTGQAKRLALAFSFQVQEKPIELQPWDQKVHCIVTEKETIQVELV